MPGPDTAERPSQRRVGDRRPWLEGVVACATELEARAVLAALHARGMRSRSIPSGRSRAAWNCVVDPSRTLAVVVSGTGPAAARAAARHWVGQARAVVVTGIGTGTGLVAAPAVVLDGDESLAARARTALRTGDPAAVGARVASAAETAATEAARASLAGAGVAVLDGESDTWREAGGALGIPVLACRAVAALAPLPPRLAALQRGGAARRSVVRSALDVLLHPGDRRAMRAADAAATSAMAPAARAAVAALVGPG